MDEKLKALIQFIGKHSERESIALYPNPSWNINTYTLLDEVVRLYGLAAEDVDRVLAEASS